MDLKYVMSRNSMNLLQGETEILEIQLNENSYKWSSNVAFTFQLCGLFMEGYFF